MKITIFSSILILLVSHTAGFAASKQEKCRSVAEMIVASATDVTDAKSRENRQIQLENDCMNKPDEAVDQIYRDTLQVKKETP